MAEKFPLSYLRRYIFRFRWAGGYQPEKHYMRGPGPAALRLSEQKTAAQDSFASAPDRLDDTSPRR